MNLEEDHKTILANERTYAAWIRTGLTALATGLGCERFLGGVIPDPVIRAISMSLLSFSILAFILGAQRYIHVGAIVSKKAVSGAPVSLIVLLSLLLILVTLMAIIGVWM